MLSSRSACCDPSCSYAAPHPHFKPSRAAPASVLRSRSHHNPCIARSTSVPQPSKKHEMLRDADVIELNAFLEVFKSSMDEDEKPEGPGQVFLVGTGPGDPGLLTLRAVQVMQTADVVLYDRLVSDDILRLVNPAARMVYVGKEAGYHTRTQDEIHALLLAFSEAGASVVRLKGGDPYVFGRGGEEVQYLMSHGIKVYCVPGITAAAGICAELGIPMTHRGVATSARFLTGHSREGGEEMLVGQMAGGADPHTTLIVYMGLQTLPTLYKQLTDAGMPPSMPAVAVERGTTRDQRVVFSPLSELPARTKEARLKSPTLLIIGEVVALAPGWQDWQQHGMPLQYKQERARYKAFDADVLADPALVRAIRDLPVGRDQERVQI